MSEKSPQDRLRHARIQAGYRSGSEAAKAHGWPIPTYLGHENGGRGFSARHAQRYGAAFMVDPAWLLLGMGEAAPGRPESAAVILHQMPDGKARLQINTTVPWPVALEILALIEGKKS